ncbi:hypothetical protein K466DRAFT_575484 [Polyporus arcularius HHB13444]|uniref:AN1-type domain-containing protein n=1 Tax=Polyporus arcularius HHB13444 TaxID=1314778 RepID=A0A5C3PG23_9APHY|nr:hypothetical protein K466DRAFT_575484 [Polyporus arcularius HHB13444]
MSGSSTPERDTHLLEVGKQCSSPSCLLVDFLPFKCQHCGDHFCGDHFLPNAHSCAKYDAAKHDRIAPPCPLCNTPVAIPPGQDPNVRMERHINTECSVMTGRKAKSGTPTCARPKCGKVLFAPIRCDSCKQQFCPQHRFPKDHTCAANRASSKQSPANTWANVSNQTSAASAAAVAALKRATATPTSSGRSPEPTKTQSAAPTKPAASSSRSNPFSSTDR